jgi:hypothetical protein
VTGGCEIVRPVLSNRLAKFFRPQIKRTRVAFRCAPKRALYDHIGTGSPLQVVFHANDAWISNVKIPSSMLPAGADERVGGLVRLNLSSYQIRHMEGTEDANGIAIIHSTCGDRYVMYVSVVVAIGLHPVSSGCLPGFSEPEKKVKVRGLPHLAKNERDMGHPTIPGRDKREFR